MANTYIHGHDSSVLASHRWRGVDNSANYLISVLHDGDRLLDVGCGPGTITRDFVRFVPGGYVVALDRTPTIIEEAVGGDTHVFGVEGDVYNLPFQDRSFDIVHAHQVLQHLGDPQRAIREMARVAKRFVAFADADYDRMLWWPSSPSLERWMQLYQAIAAHNHVNPNIGRELSSLALYCGLFNHQVHTTTWTYATTELVHWWADSWAGRVLHSTYASEALRLGLSSQEELTTLAQGWQEWATKPGAIFVITSIAILASL